MQLVSTKSFQLAVNAKGDPNSTKLAILLPGRLDTKDYANFSSHIEFLASLGYFAVSLDPPGTWDSPGDISLFTTTNYLQAVSEIIEYYGSKPTILMGHSRGGAIAILAGSVNPNVKAIITLMPSFGGPSEPSPEALKNGFELESRDLPPGNIKSKARKTFSLPLTYFQDGQKYNIEKVLTTCAKPKLILYANQDEFCDPSDVKKIYKSISDPKDLHELNCKHDYRYYPEIIIEINQLVASFLRKTF